MTGKQIEKDIQTVEAGLRTFGAGEAHRALNRLTSMVRELFKERSTLKRRVTSLEKRFKNGNAKLDEDKVKFIKAHPHMSSVYLATLFGVTKRNINCVRTGRTWSHVTTDKLD